MSRIRAKAFAALAAIAAAFLAGCGGDSAGGNAAPGAANETAVSDAASTNAQEKAVEKDPVKRRMSDEEYVKTLDKRHQERREIMKKLSAAKANLDNAKGAGAPADEVRALEGEMKKVLAEMKRHEAESRAMVGAKMQQDMIENGQNK